LRVAAGEKLPLAQQDIRFQGHAIEVRLCAEDVPAGFMPQSGTMRRWQLPEGLRVEHALHSGAVIPPYYDSMIAKLIAHGQTRDEARRRLLRGLQDTVALGVRTNQDFLARCLAHPVFAAGGATTAFIAQQEGALLDPGEKAMTQAALVGAWLLQETSGKARHSASGRSLAHGLSLGVRFALDGNECVVTVSQTQPHVFSLTSQGREHLLESVRLSGHEARFILDGVMESVAFDRDGSSLWLRYVGRPHAIEDRTRAAAARQGDAGGDGKVRASMNGRVVAILAAVGDKVAAGQPLVTLEAMKMEHVHTAPMPGTIVALHVSTGEQVQAHRVVAEIQADPQPAQGAAK
ncbi:MAG: Methylcrotonoyl-CoA carboxylase, partial [Ramlibacter sp.]|nr:Methylcrotonoyl-CoA carboxylase [Ramlibacter sp.]